MHQFIPKTLVCAIVLLTGSALASNAETVPVPRVLLFSSATRPLQPLSVQGQIGLDIAAGVGSLDLHPSW